MITLFWPEQSSHFLTRQYCLHHRHNLTLVSTCNICISVLVSLFGTPNSLNKLPEMLFVFPFNPTGKSTMAFLTGQSWYILKSWYTGGAQNNDFGAVPQMDLIKKFTSICGAGCKESHF